MVLYNSELKNELHNFFIELKSKTDTIVLEARTSDDAIERIMRLVSTAVAAEVEGYLVDLYAILVEKTKKEEFFQNPDNLNAFYRLNLRNELNEKYQFNIESIDAYRNGIQSKEVNKLYATLGATAGTLALGGILKFALSSVINIPFAVIVAGALVVACATYLSIPSKNKKEYKLAVDKFLNDLENDILDWFADIEIYFNERVSSLYI